MQDSLNKVKDETYRLRQDVTELQCKADNPNFLHQPPTLTYEGSVPSKYNAKPRAFDGNDDFGEYLSHFEIISEMNNWDYHTKSLQLASALAVSAVGILGELTSTDRRNFNTLVKILHTRFGSAERSELYRACLKAMKKGKDETLSQ